LTRAKDGGMASADRYTNHEYWKRQNADFKEVMSELAPGIPLVCVCGNHDVGDRPTPASLRQYSAEYGDDYYSFWCGGMRAFVLNSQLLNNGLDAPEAQSAQAAWLSKELEDMASGIGQQAKHAVVFQHIPWFVRDESEPSDGVFNFDPSVRMEWLSRMRAAHVSKVFCGHYHRNAGGYTADGELEVVVTSAVGRQLSAEEVATNKDLMDLSDTRSGMRIVSVGEESIDHKYYEFSELEVSLGIVDEAADECGFLTSLDARCGGRA